MKIFTVAGHSTLAGVKKLRFATNMDRVKVLMRNGHTDIQLQTLPNAMTKDEIRVFFADVPVGPVAVAAVAPVAAAVAPTDDQAGPDPVKWLEPGEIPSWQKPEAEAETKVTYATIEEALAAVPLRAKGRFIKKEVREQMARELMAA